MAKTHEDLADELIAEFEGNTRDALIATPYPAEKMQAWPVSARVNSIGNRDALLLEPSNRLIPAILFQTYASID